VKKILLSFTFIMTVMHSLAQGWVKLGEGSCALRPNNVILAICSDTGNIIYAAGGFTDSLSDTAGKEYVAKWDGSCWSKLGSAVPQGQFGEIASLCLDDSHNLYAAGSFSDSNGKVYVSKWNGSVWSELGTDSNALNANSSISSICVDEAGNVYAAGEFTNASAVAYVAKWNGATWSELGAGSEIWGPSFFIYTVCADAAGNIYAAGEIEDSEYYFVAKWNGATWSRLGGSTLHANEQIFTVVADTNGNIYAAGGFTDSNGYAYVAKWDGSSWSELGTGPNALNSYLLTMVFLDKAQNIYAINQSRTTTYDNVYRWNGGHWIGVGSLNANSLISSVCTDQAGNIYAAGGFTDSSSSIYGHTYVAEYAASQLKAPYLSQSNIAKVYPNPAHDFVNLDLLNAIGITEYDLYNVYGSLVRKGQSYGQPIQIYIGDLPDGVYGMQLRGSINSYYKIIKD
jgi:hypothetical protein